MKRISSRIKLISWMVGVPVAIAFGCIHLDQASLHFRSPGPDFGRAPLRYDLNGYGSEEGSSDWRPRTEYLDARPHGDLTGEESPFDENYFYKVVTKFENAGQFSQALTKWKWAQAKKVGPQAICDDRIQLLTWILNAKDRTGAVDILRATSPLKSANLLPEGRFVSRAMLPILGFEGCVLSKGTANQRGKQFVRLAESYSDSPVAQTALVRAAKSYLLQPASSVQPETIRSAQQALARLQSRYPKLLSRYEILGWQGRIAYLKRQYPQAIQTYRSQIRQAKNQDQVRTALNSIVLCDERLGLKMDRVATLLEAYDNESSGYGRAVYYRILQLAFNKFGPSDAKQFWRKLRTEPRLLSAYLDFREEMDHPSKDLINLASRRIETALKSPYGAHILARISEAAYNLGEIRLAKTRANEAKKLARRDSDQALATYLLASIAKEQGDWASARNGYQTIIKSYPKDYLVSACRENMALIYERAGDLGKALNEYWLLNYDHDIAYLIDIRMSPNQLKRLIDEAPKGPHAKLLHYSLGLRYLRKDQFHLAAQQFHFLTGNERHKFSHCEYGYSTDSTYPTDIQDPLITAQELGTLNARYQSASSRSAKADAKWKIASYYYNHRNLLLYNPALWQGDRAIYIGMGWNPAIANRADYKALEIHHWEHDCYAKTLQHCREFLREFPKSQLRFQVAYRGACAAERLSRMNTYWRWEGERKDLLGQSVNLMSVARKSPDPSLAKSAKKFATLYANSREIELAAFRDVRKNRQEHTEPGQVADWTWY